MPPVERGAGRGEPFTPRALTAAAALGLAGVVLLAALAGAAASPARDATPVQVLAITQSPGTLTEQDGVTVSLQVADASNIQQVYFTFCQITNSLCYFPVTMTPQASNWFVGTTSPMTQYSGMDPGVSAGYNITIQYKDNSTSSEPAIPNAFPDLTVATTVTGEFVYKVTVAKPTYALGGRVYDASTGTGIAGATVSIAPSNGTTTTTDATGAYTLPPMPNGSYTLNVSHAGYANKSVPIVIANQAVVQDVPLSNTTAPPTHASKAPGFFASTTGLAVIGAVVVVAALAVAAVVLMRRRRGGGAATDASTPDARSGA